MFHTDLWEVVKYLGDGKVGLEKEALRITEDGFLAQTRDPFVGNPNIVKDFSENQTEINTPVCSSTEEAVGFLEEYSALIRKTIGQMPEPELLWPFSNPPYIRDESEIPVAQYEGADRAKTEYRNYLAERYGKYMMTFSGIHFNYSFSDELLKAEYEAVRGECAGAGAERGADAAEAGAVAEARGSAERGTDAADAGAVAEAGSSAERGTDATDAGAGPYSSFRDFKNHFYVSLAAKMLVYNWLIVAVTAASPILDISYLEKGKKGQSVFGGLASVRCSELGYWNFFTPVLDYSSLEKYAESILGYIRYGIIRSESELYFPVRIKPAGKYDVAKMAREGVSHIELRMIDLNPYERGGMDVRDAEFIKLLLIYVAALPELEVTAHEQILAVNNTKSAAHYDIDEVKIALAGAEKAVGDCREKKESPADSHVPKGSETMELRAAALCVIGKMEAFFAEVAEPFGGQAAEAAALSGQAAEVAALSGQAAERTLDAEKVQAVLAYQRKKFEVPEARYAFRVREEYGEGFVEKGLKLAKEYSKI